MFKPSRRQLLFSAIGVMSVLAARDFFVLYCGGVPRNTPDFFASLDDGAIDAARAVGQRVRVAHPDFGSERALARHYSDRPLLAAADLESCVDTRLAMLKQQCCEDFAAGRIVTIDNWVLSETEAQLCASVA